MADIEHKNIPDVNLHEPKGVAGAAVDTVYVADGNGSGAWSSTRNKLTVKNVGGTVVTANSSTSYTIDTSAGSVHDITLTGNCTFTFTAAQTDSGIELYLRQDATGSRTVTWPASVVWPGGTAPTITATASNYDKYIFRTIDGGTTWEGGTVGQAYS